MSKYEKGLLDTSVVIDINSIDPDMLPEIILISTITLAELSAGPHASKDSKTIAIRQSILQRAERTFDPIDFDSNAASSYGRIYSAVISSGQKARGARAVDLMIASVALANGLPLFTRNPKDFKALVELMDIVAI